jgi:uncharacterized Zn finger protein (UPF0148 family)
MNCPKCNKELLNVNGKYVCVDCGIEVPEAENSLQGTPDTKSEQSVPAVDAALEEEADKSETTDVPKTEESPSSEKDEAETTTADEFPETPPAPQNDLMPIKPEAYESVPVSDLEGGTKPSFPPEPVVPENQPVADEVKPIVTEDLPSDVPKMEEPLAPSSPDLPTEAPVYPQEPAQEPVSQEPDPVTAPENEIAGPIKPIEISMDNPAEPADLFEKKGKNDFQPEQSTFNSSSPLDQSAIPQMPSAVPIPPDPATIFQDPMYDKNSAPPVPSSPISQTSTASMDPEDSDKKLKIILIAGITVAVLLLIGGIVAYIWLT